MVIPFNGLKAPEWRVASWLALDDMFRRGFESRIKCLCETLPFSNSIADIELVGSYAFECAYIGSDVDLNICLKSKQEQDLAQEWWRGKSDAFRDFLIEFWKVENQYGIHIDLFPGTHDSKSYAPLWSIYEQRFYNKEPGEVLNYKLKWNKDLLKYEPVEKVQKKVSYEVDKWLR